jgi:hypothetical protein
VEQHLQHESFGAAVVSYVHGGDENLCMSTITHANRVRLSIKHADLYRGLHETRVNPRQEIVTVEFSELQWGQLISRLGKAEGTPCTIKSIGRKGVAKCPPDTTFAQLRVEIEEKAEKVAANFEELESILDAFAGELQGSKPPAKGTVKTFVAHVQRQVDQTRSKISSDMPFLAEQINRQISILVEDVVQSVLGTLARRADYERAKATADRAMLPEAIDADADDV